MAATSEIESIISITDGIKALDIDEKRFEIDLHEVFFNFELKSKIYIEGYDDIVKVYNIIINGKDTELYFILAKDINRYTDCFIYHIIEKEYNIIHEFNELIEYLFDNNYLCNYQWDKKIVINCCIYSVTKSKFKHISNFFKEGEYKIVKTIR